MFELAAGSSAPTVLPFAALKDPDGLALDSSGSVYVAETFNNRVLKLAAGSSTPTVLPFTGLNHPGVWRWTPQATSTSSTRATIGC